MGVRAGPGHGHLRAAAAINDGDLLAEEVDETSGEMIGNFPQAFSHIGLINARLGHQPGPRNTCLR